MASSKIKGKKQGTKQDLAAISRKRTAKEKSMQKYDWDFTVNFVSFENENDRQRSYELWIESFFHFVN